MFKITSGGDKRPGGVDVTAALTQHCQPRWPCHTWVSISWAEFKPLPLCPNSAMASTPRQIEDPGLYRHLLASEETATESTPRHPAE